MIGCCGLDCAACEIYIAAHDPAAATRLAAAWRAGGTADARPDWFRCQGCHGDRSRCWSDDCRLHACCAGKGQEHCGQCADFACEPYQQWVGNWPHHRTARARMQALRENGR
ncbi:MAG TPA: DUF3795 domain-containing protein [Armatimonadota bacterium]|nr:DUF3795 domain-containing protein [Armatimonadota bacterium]